MKVLGFYTLDVHELTHHLDFMSTPFGINFHQKPLFEFLVFQNFSANLLLHPEYLVGGNRLQDFHALLAKIGYNPKLFYLWKQIRKRSMVFDAYFNQVKDTIGYGWSSPLDMPTNFLGIEFIPIMVNGFMYIIQLPSDRSYYLRPGTILEARSLIHSLTWLLYQLGYDSKANSQIVQPWTKYST